MSITRRVLIVEEQAHVRVGHFPVLFAETAAALVDLGCEVTVLTTQGWVLEDPQHPSAFSVRRLDGLAGTCYRFGLRLGRRVSARWAQVTKRVICDIAVTVGAGRLATRLDAEVIMLTHRPRPYAVLLFANARRWVVLQWFEASKGPAGWTDRLGLQRLILLLEGVRRRRGGATALVANSDAIYESWRSTLPRTNVRKFVVAGARMTHSNPDVRQQLGLPSAAKIALIFGTDHGGKDLAPVLECFAAWQATGEHPDWHLIAASDAGASAQRWQQERGLHLDRVHVYAGFVSHRMREDLHDAVDAIVLSFRPGWRSDSGTLADAVAWGKPVVCSDQCGPAELVTSLGVGVLFESGSSESLGAALGKAPLGLSAEVKRRARTEYGMKGVAERYLGLLGSMGH